MQTTTTTPILRIIRYLIFLVVFNAFFFLLVKEFTTSVWISYGFIHFAYFMLLITGTLVRKGKSESVFTFPLFFLSWIYFIVVLITGVFFIWVVPIWADPEAYRASLLIQLSFAGIYGILLVTHMIANEWTADAEKERQVHISFIKDASAKMKGLVDSVSDKDVRKKVERVYDALYSSPVKSHPELATAEERILRSIRTLESAIAAGDRDEIVSLAGSLETAINERNRQLKTYN